MARKPPNPAKRPASTGKSAPDKPQRSWGASLKLPAAFAGGMALMFIAQSSLLQPPTAQVSTTPVPVAPQHISHDEVETLRAQQQELESQLSDLQKQQRKLQQRVDGNAASAPAPTPAPAPARTPPSQRVPGWECDVNDDCPGTTTVCNPQHKCEQLRPVSCICQPGQPNVLQCYDPTERARHTYCENGCEMTSTGARCK